MSQRGTWKFPIKADIEKDFEEFLGTEEFPFYGNLATN